MFRTISSFDHLRERMKMHCDKDGYKMPFKPKLATDIYYGGKNNNMTSAK
jgi:hypothetical protein